jgi:two-component system sensor histidine kinase PilS (NtrC family)
VEPTNRSLRGERAGAPAPDARSAGGSIADVPASAELAQFDVLAASVAHEIRNPLGAMRRALAGLGAEASLGDSCARVVDLVVEELDRLGRLTTKLLALGRSGILSPAPVNLGALVERAARLLRLDPRLAEGVSVETRLAEGLPDAWIDSDRILQVVWNLGLNAAEVVPAYGKIGFDVGRERLAGRSGVALAVSDTGPGIPREARRRIFEPFESRRAGGTGLGLALSQTVVRLHGGRIVVRDAPGGGALFEVWLPVAPPRDARRGDRSWRAC